LNEDKIGVFMSTMFSKIVLGLLASASSETLPLPERRDIPADFSTVICPNEAQARRMMSDYTAQGPAGLDQPTFFNGLRVTGCQQRSGPLQIEAVLERKTLETGPTTYMLYRARGPSGAIVYGTIDERGNNRHARTPFEAWINSYTEDGFVSDTQAEKPMYICRSPQATRNVIAAIPAHRRGAQHLARQLQAKKRAFQVNGCVLAKGRFRVQEIHNKVYINKAYEVSEHWVAVTATNAVGASVGLLYDASQL
jgi:hypothetical protein